MLRSETANDPHRMRAALAGLRAYQHATRGAPLPAMPVVAEAGRASLRDYGGDGPPVLFVPSLINPPHVLDLDAERSLLRWLAANGHHPLMIDWGTPTPGEAELGIAAHVETMLLPLLRTIDGPVALAGYCLGGTMALAAAARHPVRALALIATPWRFAGYAPSAREGMAALWRSARAPTDALGLLPMEVLQAGFWQIDPARTVRKYEAFAALDPASPAAAAFIALEDWANDGAPLTRGAAAELLEGFHARDLPGTGMWQVAGAPIDPAAIRCPVLDIMSSTDSIVPAAAAAALPGSTRLTLALGHVGMIIGGRARAALWEPLARWLSNPHAPC